MILVDNLNMMYCLNDNGLTKVHELLKGLLEKEEYTQISLEQLKKENEESSEQRKIQWKKEEEERKLKKEEKNNQIKQQFKKELKLVGEQSLPLEQLELIYAIQDIEECNSMMLCKVYLWGYIQGKRHERSRRKKANTVKDGSNVPIATMKQIIINRIKSMNDLKALQDIYSPLVEKDIPSQVVGKDKRIS